MDNTKRQIVFDIRLLCDIESIHFDISRNCISRITKQTILMKEVNALKNNNLEAGTKELLARCRFTDTNNIDTIIKEITTEFYKYINIVKPRLLIHGLTKQLIAGDLNIIAYSHYEDTINEYLKKNIAVGGIPIVKATNLDQCIKTPCTLITGEDPTKFLSKSLIERNSFL